MNWLREKRQDASYLFSFHCGERGEPYRCPWWADAFVCGLAYEDGCKSLAVSKERGL